MLQQNSVYVKRDNFSLTTSRVDRPFFSVLSMHGLRASSHGAFVGTGVEGEGKGERAPRSRNLLADYINVMVTMPCFPSLMASKSRLSYGVFMGTEVGGEGKGKRAPRSRNLPAGYINIMVTIPCSSSLMASKSRLSFSW